MRHGNCCCSSFALPIKKAAQTFTWAAFICLGLVLAAIAKQTQQHDEQVDEVQIQGQRAHERFFG